MSKQATSNPPSDRAELATSHFSVPASSIYTFIARDMTLPQAILDQWLSSGTRLPDSRSNERKNT
jgi:hypothetical protein